MDLTIVIIALLLALAFGVVLYFLQNNNKKREADYQKQHEELKLESQSMSAENNRLHAEQMEYIRQNAELKAQLTAKE